MGYAHGLTERNILVKSIVNRSMDSGERERADTVLKSRSH